MVCKDTAATKEEKLSVVPYIRNSHWKLHYKKYRYTIDIVYSFRNQSAFAFVFGKGHAIFLIVRG